MDDFQKDIDQCIDVLQKGGIILYPTDTIWGIGCDAKNEEAVKKIFHLKERNEIKSMIILVADEQEISNYTNADISKVLPLIINQPKPTTIIYPSGKKIASNIIGADGSIGIRIVQDSFCKSLINKFGSAIVSTSANISGKVSPNCFNELDEKIKKGVDYIVQYKQHELNESQASRIIRFDKNGTISVIRP